MNARQKCKKLKKTNKLLLDVVNGNPDFLSVFNYWSNKSFKVLNSQVHFQTYAATYPVYSLYGKEAREIAELNIVEALSDAMKDNIEWRVETDDSRHVTLEGRIMIAKKEEV